MRAEGALFPALPDEGIGEALEDLEQEEDEAGHGDLGHDEVGGEAEAGLVAEEGEVEAENGELGQGDDGEVEGLGDVEELFFLVEDWQVDGKTYHEGDRHDG